jgi:arylsulfatase A-like enzyme
VVREIGSHLDILPSICGAAGVSPPADRTFDGFDALPLAVSGAKSRHDAIFWASGGQLAVRRGPWKLVKDGKIFDGTPSEKPLAGDDAQFLSNLEEDPGEQNNLRHKFPQVADELASAIAAWSAEVKKQ